VVAAVGVAAHESGHALQHQAAYAPLKARMVLVPVTSFASNAAIFLSIGSLFFGFAKLAVFGIAIYGIIALFQLVTLPVEFDASRRAKEQLVRLGLIDNQEHRGVSDVLGAAALTYVAAMVATLFSLLHFIMIARDSDR
jgi:Zn-dependent membrane protease YugP